MLFPHLNEHSQKEFKPSEDDFVSELHDMATDKYHYSLEEYIRNLPSRGIDQDKFIHCLERYCGSYQSLKDCFIVCRCFEIVASRKAIPIIERIQVINEAENNRAQEIKANAIFRIQRTSLQ